jgi:SAM-dependent methyltransferase
MGFLDLKHQEVYDLDDPRRTIQHRDIILSKPFLKKIYEEWYGVFKDHSNRVPRGMMLELGSGGGFLKQVIPEVVTSDVLSLPGLVDIQCYAQQMPFDDATVSAIFMTNVFHHIPDSAAFLKEASRVLMPGGRVVMIEPANTWFSRKVYTHAHHEPFDPEGPWHIDSTGPMSGSNQALPYIVFERDEQRFRQEFPWLQIVEKRLTMPVRYLLSGGVSKKQLVPTFTFGMIRMLEHLIPPVTRLTAMFQIIVLEKKP